MLWIKKISIEKQKEIHLNILHLEKLIQRAIENANNATIAFNKSYEIIFTHSDDSDELPTDFKAVLSTAKLMSAKLLIEQNEGILEEIKPLINSRLLKAPAIIREKLKDVQKKNYQAKIMFLSHQVERKEDETNEASWTPLFREIILRTDSKSDLLQLESSLNDFQALFQRCFPMNSFDYVHNDRLNELKSVENQDFDLSKLICLCDELNSAFQNENYLSVAMIIRAILDHVPPLFGYKTFIEVANNYGGRSLKKSLQNLQNSSRNIADAYLHEPIRRKESLPNQTQIDFRNDLDVLLAEIVRNFK